MKPWIALLVVAAASSARADSKLDRLLAENPPLALLARHVDKVQLELASCSWFGEDKPADCKRHMTAQEITRILGRVHAPANAKEHVYCVSYNHPVVADRSFRPVTGFRCWLASEYATESLELTCSDVPQACSLHYHASNDDEDSDYRYDFRLVGRGRSLEIENNKVSFSFEHRN